MRTKAAHDDRYEILTTPGLLTIEPVDPGRDAALVHEWLAHPASEYWRMASLSADEIVDYLTTIALDDAQAAWLGRLDGQPTFLVETYDPAVMLPAEAVTTSGFTATAGDVGMHLLVAPPRGRRLPGLTSAVMRTVVRFVFERLQANRVVVEPDVHNERIAAKNAEIGFRALGDVTLPGKRATISVLTRNDFRAAHLAAAPMALAHRHLVAKAIAEFAHERLLKPLELPDGWFCVGVDDDRVEYRFRAVRHTLEHWVIDEASIVRRVREANVRGDSPWLAPDALELIIDCQSDLAIPPALLATYLEEISSTLASAAFKQHAGGPSAARLATADYQTIERSMTEGHPAFLANNGRIGFDLDDFHAFAPEVGAPLRLMWLAARAEHTRLTLGTGLDAQTLYGTELGPETLSRFAATLEGKGLDPDEYRYLPVHPWQWQNRISTTFATDIARRELVLLGEGDDDYQAQQSIRTCFNRTRPERHLVKMALAVQNMGFLRGLSPEYMRCTPAINDWVDDLVRTDSTLAQCGFAVLRERAAIGWTGDIYHRALQPSAHHKMVAALWRESPVPLIAPTQRLSTMAALLHRDRCGRAVASELVRSSGFSAPDWIRAYLHAYLRPLVHCLLAHDLAFMPHSENLILVFEGAVPVRALMKDIGEEVTLLTNRRVPNEIGRIVHPANDREKALSIFTDVFDGVFRFLAAILDDDGILPEGEFWALVTECVERHRDEHPDLESTVDLRSSRFAHSCLNRLQLRNTLHMVDLADQSGSLIYAGEIANPIGRRPGE